MRIWKEQGEYRIYAYDKGNLHIIGGTSWFLLAVILIYLAFSSELPFIMFLCSFLSGLCLVLAFFITADGIQLRAIYEPNRSMRIGYSMINILLEIFLPFLN